MFFRYSFLSLSLAYSYYIMTNSMSIDHLPLKHQDFLRAVSKKNNTQAEHILQENPEINSNITIPDEHIPYVVAACFHQDNDHMLRFFIDKGGLDTKNFGHSLQYWAREKQYQASEVLKVLIKHGALKQLTPEQQFTVFDALFFLPAAHTEDAIKCALDNGFDITSIKQNFTALFKTLSTSSKYSEITAYCIYATHYTEHFDKVAVEQTDKHSITNNLNQIHANFINILHALRKNGINFTLKIQDYTELLTFLASQGNTYLIKYLLLYNGPLPFSDLQVIITHAKINSIDPVALEFIDDFSSAEPVRTEYEKTVKQDVIYYLKQQWLKHKNKSVVLLLRRFATIQRLFSAYITPEIAHKIAQYAIADFQDAKLDYLPSYQQVQELIAQKKLEYQALNI